MTPMEECICSSMISCTNDCVCNKTTHELWFIIFISVTIGWYMKSFSPLLIQCVKCLHDWIYNHYIITTTSKTKTEIAATKETINHDNDIHKEWNDDKSNNSSITTISSSSSLEEVITQQHPKEEEDIHSFIHYSQQIKTSLEAMKKQDNAAIDCTNLNDDDGTNEVLYQSIILFMKQFFNFNDNNVDVDNICSIKSNCNQNHNQIKKSKQSNVVNYLSPKEMANLLFHKQNSATSFTLHENNIPNNNNNITSTTTTANTKSTNSTNSTITPNQMMKLFSQINHYSVNTNHKLFFNQLFGTLDPIALAAEVIALGLHTSSYTWETAPVFTLMEREVFVRLGQLVFERDGDNKGIICTNSQNDNDDIYNELVHNKYDGLMLPGGSLSNLTAIHVARHYCLYGTRTRQHMLPTKNDDIFSTSGMRQEEKKDQSNAIDSNELLNHTQQPQLIAFVSSEAHYSFSKAASVTGIGIQNLISVPTLSNGQMDVDKLDMLLTNFHNDHSDVHRIPFFVAATAGSTVRGSFDDISAIVNVCRKHEEIINRKFTSRRRCKIWVHVDGAWGGSAIFSSRADMRQLLNGVQHVDSFTFNPHKLIGAPQQTTAFISRHRGILKAANSSGAKYLFDCRKNGAECDLGDDSYTCGRKPDAIKLWALWKYYGCQGIGHMMEKKADSLSLFARMVQNHDSFMLACTPWPFNVNFFYLPERIRKMLKDSGVDTTSENPVIPDEISREIAIVSVKLKLKLHQSGVMIIPYQPLSNQKADCFRLVLAGNKVFEEKDYVNVLQLMEKYGSDM